MGDQHKTQSNAAEDLVVVFGPRTALARQVLSSRWAEQKNLMIVARNQEEARWAHNFLPRAAVLACWLPQDRWKWPAACRRVTVLLCGFGIIHPVAPVWASHCRAMTRDAEVLTRIVQRFRQQTINVVLVSSICAWALTPERAYYTGWKCLAEALVRNAVSTQEKARLSVLYPGRLVNQKTLRRPLSFLHTSYSRLSRRLIRIAQSSQARSKIVGLDARMLLLLRTFGSISNAVFK